jgi:hypothetical protein
MRYLYILFLCAACYAIPFAIGNHYPGWWTPLLMFWGGMAYKAYLHYDGKVNK